MGQYENGRGVLCGSNRGVIAPHDGGESILQKAAKLKKFIKQQRGKLEKSKSLHEWMVAQQRLQDECGAAERDFLQAHGAISELLLAERDEVASVPEDTKHEAELKHLKRRVQELRQCVASGRGRRSTPKDHDVIDELKRVKEELAKAREKLDRQELDCACSGPSALSTDAEQDLDFSWQTRLQSLIAKFPNASDEMERIEMSRSLAELENAHTMRLSEMAATAPPGSHSGWSPEDHETFLRVRRAGLAGASGTCQPQAEIVSSVCRMMPHKTQRDVVQHLEWYAQKLLWQRKLDDLDALHTRQLDEAFERLESKLSKKEATFHTAAASAFDSIQREAAQSHLQTKLANQRQTQAESAQRELQNRLALVEAEAETRRQEERKAKEDRLKSKELLAKYHSEIECLAREKAREEARGKALREEAAKAEACLNAERVEFRRREHARKVEQLRRAVEKSEEEQREKEERLAKLRAKVAIQAEADKDRVLRPTAAVLAAEKAAKDSELFPVHGFRMDELMKDKRFRLGLALREAGLHKTGAARDALLAAGPKDIRRDTLSTLTFGSEKLPR